jgi:hypothetical protein
MLSRPVGWRRSAALHRRWQPIRSSSPFFEKASSYWRLRRGAPQGTNKILQVVEMKTRGGDASTNLVKIAARSTFEQGVRAAKHLL